MDRRCGTRTRRLRDGRFGRCARALDGSWQQRQFRQSHSDGVPWNFPGVDETLRKPIARQTCNGCHNGEVQQIEGFYHISPMTAPGATGQNNLSPFLKNADLPARKAGFQALLCPAPGTALGADGTPVPPAKNGRTH